MKKIIQASRCEPVMTGEAGSFFQALTQRHGIASAAPRKDFSGLLAVLILTLILTFDFANGAGFSGDFSQAGGAVYDSGGADVLYNVAYDSSSDSLFAAGVSGNNFLTVKYDNAGNVVSSATFPCGALDAAYGIAVSPLQNAVFVAGTIMNANKDCVIIKYSQSLLFLASATFDSGGVDIGRSVAVSSFGPVYIVGYTSNPATVSNDFLALKYSSSLQFLSSATFGTKDITGTIGNDLGYACAIPADGNLYVCGQGYFIDSACFETVKFSPNLVFISSTNYGGDSYNHAAYDISSDASGNIYVIGESNNGLNFDYRIIKYNSSLSEVTNFVMPVAHASLIFAGGITASPSGKVFASGFSGGGNRDYLTMYFDSSLILLSSQTYSGANSDTPYDVAYDLSGNVFAGGSSNNGTDDDWRMIKYGVDVTSPSSAVTYPVSISSFTVFPVFSGTAQDTAGFNGLIRGVSRVDVAVKRQSDQKWWNGSTSAWDPAIVFNVCAGKDNWSYNALKSSSAYVGYYWIVSRSSDNSGNLEINLGAGATIYFDNFAPSSISNLTALTGSVTEGDIILKWTAPGEDGTSGAVTSYSVKYATYQITSALFDSAATFYASWPGLVSGGNEEQRTLTGLAGGATYFFAIKSYDAMSNYSVWNSSIDTGGINTANFASAHKIPPGAVTDLAADIAASNEGALRLTWSMPGDDVYATALPASSLIYIATTTDIANAGNDAYWEGRLSGALAEIQFSTSGISPGFKSSRILTGLVPGVTYYFRIWVRDECPGNWSSISAAATSYAQIDISSPAAIASVLIDELGFRHARLKWTAPVGDSQVPPFDTGQYSGAYEIRYATAIINNESMWSSAIYYSTITKTIVPGQEELLTLTTGMVNNVKYYFSVKTRDENNLWSVVSSSSPSATPSNIKPGLISGPSLLTNDPSNGGQFYVNGGFKASSSTIINFTAPGPYWTVPSAGDSPVGVNDSSYGDFISSYSLIYFPYFGGSSITVSGLPANTTIYNFTSAVENTTYYWYIEAYDSESAYARSTLRTLSFNSVNDAASQFSLIKSSGLMSYAGANTNIPLAWNRIFDPDPGDYIAKYIVYWSSYSNFPSTAAFSETIISTRTSNIYISSVAYTITSPLAEHSTYWWYVVAYDSGGPFGWYNPRTVISNSTWSFVVNGVNQAPDPFSLVWPSSFSAITPFYEIYTSSPAFLWNRAVDPDPGDNITYEIFYTSTVFTGLENIGVGSATSYTVATALIENTTYSWKVQAHDVPGLNMGPQTTESEIRKFAVNAASEPPTVPVLLGPFGSTVSLTPTFSWQACTDPDLFDYVNYYKLYLSTDNGFALNVTTITPPVVNTSTQVAFSLLTSTSYFWKVAAFGYNETIRSVTNIFSISQSTPFIIANQPPYQFDIVSPTGSVIVANSSITFIWQANGDPDGNNVTYTLKYSSSSDFTVTYSSTGTKFINASTITIPVQPAFSIFENTTCYWFVTGDDPYDERQISKSSGTFRLNSISEPPNSFDLTGPSSTTPAATPMPAFVWSSSSDNDPGDSIQYYSIFYSSDNFLTSYQSTTAATGYTPTADMQENTTYRWFVFARDKNGMTTASLSTRTITIDAVNSPPDAFDITVPTGVIRSRAPRFEWTNANITEYWEPIIYTLHWGASQFDDFTKSGITTTYYQFSGTGVETLSENTTYWWKVEATDTKPQSVFSGHTYWIFVSSTNEPPNAFALISPENNSASTNRTPVFSWQAAADPDESAGDRIVKYTLLFSKTTDFAAPQTADLASTLYSLTVSSPLSRSTTYYWKVLAFDTAGSTSTTAVWNFYVEPLVTKLKVPEGLTGNVFGIGSDAKITLNWQSVTKNEDDTPMEEGALKEYRIYRSNNPTNGFTLLSFTTGRSYTDSSGVLEYYYIVKSVNLADIESEGTQAISSGAQQSLVAIDDEKKVYALIPPETIKDMKVEVLREGNAYNIKVARSTDAAEAELVGYKFSKPVTINFKYGPSGSGVIAYAAAKTPKIFWNNGIEYVNVGGDYDSAAGKISASVIYSGKYKVQAITDTDFSYTVEPKKIFTPNKDNIYDDIKFRYINNTADSVSGDVFDLQGAFVGKMAASSELSSAQGSYLYWNGKNSSGELVKKGIYIYQLKCGSRVYTGTVIVAR